MKEVGGVTIIPTVTVGNILTLIGMVVPLIVWGVRLESRVDHEEELRLRLEREVQGMRMQNNTSFEKLEALLRRIEDKLDRKADK